jgi:hypothetical protein
MANWSKSCTRFRAAGVSVIPSSSALATSSSRLPFSVLFVTGAQRQPVQRGGLGIGFQGQLSAFPAQTGDFQVTGPERVLHRHGHFQRSGLGDFQASFTGLPPAACFFHPVHAQRAVVFKVQRVFAAHHQGRLVAPARASTCPAAPRAGGSAVPPSRQSPTCRAARPVNRLRQGGGGMISTKPPCAGSAFTGRSTGPFFAGLDVQRQS